MSSNQYYGNAGGERSNTFKEMQATGTSSFYSTKQSNFSSVHSHKSSPGTMSRKMNLFKLNQSEDPKLNTTNLGKHLRSQIKQRRMQAQIN